MRILLIAELSDYKLSSKIVGLISLPAVDSIYLVRKNPLVGQEKVINVNPKYSFFKNKVLFQVWKLGACFVVALRSRISVIYAIQLAYHAFHACIIAKIFKLPLVLWGIGKDVQKVTQKKVVGWPVRYAIRGASHVFVMGNDSLNKLERFRRANTSISILYNVVDAEQFRSREVKCLQFDFLFLGQLIRRKRVDQIIEAIGALSREGVSVSLGIAGSGVEEKSLHLVSSSLNLEDRVFFLGERIDIPDILSSVGALVLFSDAEGLPAVIIEAFLCGVPVITIQAGDELDICIDRVNSMLVKGGDFQGLVESMREFLQDAELRERLVEGAKRTREELVGKTSLYCQKKEYEEVFLRYSE